MKRSAFIALIVLAIIQDVIAQDNVKRLLGKYSCIVQVAYPNRDWAKEYIGSRLEYDADKGILDLALPIEIDGDSSWLPPQRICRNLAVETYPTNENNLHAVQFEPVSGGNQRPFVAWLMIETLDNEFTPKFKFFSTGIEAVVTGKCTHL